MRFAGVDIGSRFHELAIVDDRSVVLLKPTRITEDYQGYQRLFGLLGSTDGLLVIMEATGHYWRNLFGALCARGYLVAVINPLRTHRFAEGDLRRAKTDRTDALSIARFGAQKHPDPTPPSDTELDNLRQLVSLYRRLGQDFSDRVRQLHRLLHLVFPEFSRLVHGVDSQRAAALMSRWPSARALRQARHRQLARLCYDGRHVIGDDLAASLLDAARTSIAQHYGTAYEGSVRFLCSDLDNLRANLRHLSKQIEQAVQAHPLGHPLLSISGLGSLTVARLLASVGDPSRFRSSAALASYVGVVPGTNQSGLRIPTHAPISRIGNSQLRAYLWMPTLVAAKHNPWLRAYYERLIARGKPDKVAMIAAMRKLLTAIYAVAKSRRAFVPKLGTSA
jgi:transposase